MGKIRKSAIAVALILLMIFSNSLFSHLNAYSVTICNNSSVRIIEQNTHTNLTQATVKANPPTTYQSPFCIKTTDDYIIAQAQVKQWGAKGDGITDDTKAFESALAWAKKIGGACIYVPVGYYKITRKLNIPEGCSLRGTWSEAGTGSVLYMYYGKNKPDDWAIELKMNSAIRGLTLYWPEQINPSDPIKFAYGIYMNTASQLTNVSLINPYNGILSGNPIDPRILGLEDTQYNCSLQVLQNIYASPLNAGICMNHSTATKFTKINITPDTWANFKAKGVYLPSKDTIAHAMYAQSSGIQLQGMDGGQLNDITIKNCNIGIQLGYGSSVSASAFTNRALITQCSTGIKISRIAQAGAAFTNCIFESSGDACVIYQKTGVATVMFNNCSFGGTPEFCVILNASGGLSLYNCTFAGWKRNAINVAKGFMTAAGCTFEEQNTAVDIEFGQTATAGLIINCKNPTVVTNDVPVTQQEAGYTFATPTQVGFIYHKESAGYTETPHAATVKVFDVTKYGAIKYSTPNSTKWTDSTQAFAKAIAAAKQAGGGTVFVPGGYFHITGNLNIPSGVELRGIQETAILPSSTAMSAIFVHNNATTRKSPFITLDGKAGVRGLTIYYPEQSYNKPIDYAYTIKGKGTGSYIINVCMPNSYRAVDFGYSSDCSDSYINGLNTSPYKIGIYIGKNVLNTWLMNIEVNPLFYTYSKSGSALINNPSRNSANRADKTFNTYEYLNMNGFIFGDVDRLQAINIRTCNSRSSYTFESQGKGGASGALYACSSYAGYDAVNIRSARNIEMLASQFYQEGIDLNTSVYGERHVLLSDYYNTGVFRAFASSVWGSGVSQLCDMAGGSITLQQVYASLDRPDASLALCEVKAGSGVFEGIIEKTEGSPPLCEVAETNGMAYAVAWVVYNYSNPFNIIGDVNTLGNIEIGDG